MTAKSRDIVLKVIAFLSGAVLMSLEIVGSRVLAPYFGSSVFVWGSLIGVVLAAISVGAYLGGRLADRFPNTRPLCWLLVAAGIGALLLPTVGAAVNRQVFELDLGPRLGPFTASLCLFLIPGAALGAVTPFIVRLLVSQVRDVGTVAGTVSALSTAGSILGTLATAFLLIPEVGIGRILYLSGGLLLVLGICARLVRHEE